MKAEIFFVIQILLCTSADEFHQKAKQVTLPTSREFEGSAEFWNSNAQNYLLSKVNQKVNKNRAKNIILFLGDGLSQPTVAATRMYLGGEETHLSFEEFPYFGLIKAYCIDEQTPDSACTSTAYLSGVKGNLGTIGVNGNVKLGQCEVDDDDRTESIASWAQKSGKATGIVTTTRITHASPAGVYAHTAHRDWESNNDIPIHCQFQNRNIKDIAHQLVHGDVGKKFKVVLGCGRGNFINTTVLDEEGRAGLRTDGRNLIDEWLAGRSKDSTAKYVGHKQQLDELELNETDYLLGLFESNHCMYNLDIKQNHLQHQEPSLSDMTAAAIKMLQKEDKGFFLFVEGGRIDHAHHSNYVHKALEETREFANAIEMARKMINESETLIVVSADHSHVVTYSGYAKRLSDILGMADISDVDGLPYLTISYANGPGYYSTYNNSKRVDYTNVNFRGPGFRHSATVPMKLDTHGGDDVGVYAVGPFSHLFTGSYEQNNIPLLMAFAAQIHPYAEEDKPRSSAAKSDIISFLAYVVFLLFAMSIVC